MRCKIVRFQKLMWRNMMRSTKIQKVSVLYYSIDIVFTMSSLTTYLQETNHKLTPSIGLGPRLRMSLYIFQHGAL